MTDWGARKYTVTITFSDGFLDRDDDTPSDNPWHWNWAGLLGQPDARVESVLEERNPNWAKEN